MSTNPHSGAPQAATPAAPHISPELLPLLFPELSPAESNNVRELAMHHAQTGTYNLSTNCSPALIGWQQRQLDTFLHLGPTTMHARLESLLPGFRLSRWLRPYEVMTCTADSAWWQMAELARAQLLNVPAAAQLWWKSPGIDTSLTEWAQQNANPKHQALLSLRQRAELQALRIFRLDILDVDTAAITPTTRAQARQTLELDVAPWLRDLIGNFDSSTWPHPLPKPQQEPRRPDAPPALH